MTNTRKRIIAGLIVVAGLFAIANLSGCTSQDFANLSAARSATTQAIADYDAQSDQIKTEIAKLPPNDPARKALEKSVAKITELTTLLSAKLPAFDKAIEQARTGDNTGAITSAVSVIPVYGPLIGMVLSLGFGAFKHFQNARTNKALTQVVAGVEAALPTKTPEQKTALDSAQDFSTAAKVDAIKASFPPVQDQAPAPSAYAVLAKFQDQTSSPPIA